MTQAYREKLSALGLDNDAIDEYLALYRQQSRLFSEDAFVSFAVRQYKNEKKYERTTNNVCFGSSNASPLTVKTIDSGWYPDKKTIEYLGGLGFSLDYLIEKIPSFVFYYNSRTNKTTQYSVDLQFVHHIQFVNDVDSSNESYRSQLENAIPACIDDSWLPELATVSHLTTLGFSFDRVFELVPGFIFYYNSRSDKPTRYSVDMQFVHHVKFVDAQESTSNQMIAGQEVNHTPLMREGWWPCKKTFTILDANYSIPEIIAEGYVDEFVLYWQERHELPKSKSWKTAFIQYTLSRYKKEYVTHRNNTSRKVVSRYDTHQSRRTRDIPLREELSCTKWAE